MSQEKKKVLRIGFTTSVQNLEPKLALDVESSFVLRHVFEAPFRETYGTMEIEPTIFRGPLRRRSGNGVVLETEVREDVAFSDGTPLTAEDVARCLREAPLVREQAEIRVEGKALIFGMKRPNARFDLALSHFQCSIYRRSAAGLVGSGPYRVAPESTPAFIRLVKNPLYRNPVTIDEVHFKTYPPDASGRALGLVKAIDAGEVDLSLSLGREEIEAVTGVRKLILRGVSTAVLFLNGDTPRLADRRVRLAIARAVDRVEVAKSCYSNPLAFVATSLIPRPLGSADDDLTYDLAAARKVLAEAKGAVPDKLDMLLVWGPRPHLPYPQKVARLIIEQIGKLGIRVEVHQPATSAEFLRATLEGRHDLVLAGWVADTMDPCDFLDAMLASDRIPRKDNMTVACNRGHLRSEEMDRALDAYRADRTRENLDAIMRIVNREAPLVPLMYGPSSSVRSYRVLRFKPTPLWYVPAEHLDLMEE